MTTLKNVDDLAQAIRTVDGRHEMGAGTLAEALWPHIEATNKQQVLDAELLCRLIDHLVELRCHYVEARDTVAGYQHREDRYTQWIEEVDSDLAILYNKKEKNHD